jgi:hypothetical protein
MPIGLPSADPSSSSLQRFEEAWHRQSAQHSARRPPAVGCSALFGSVRRLLASAPDGFTKVRIQGNPNQIEKATPGSQRIKLGPQEYSEKSLRFRYDLM